MKVCPVSSKIASTIIIMVHINNLIYNIYQLRAVAVHDHEAR